jgi:hypothetical protein
MYDVNGVVTGNYLKSVKNVFTLTANKAIVSASTNAMSAKMVSSKSVV